MFLYFLILIHVNLGIRVCSDLAFEAHICIVVSKARQRNSLLFRGYVSRNLSVIHQILGYISLIESNWPHM